MSNETPVSDAWGQVKAWYKSKTIWGAIFMAVAYALRIFVPSVDTQGVADEIVGGAETLAPAIDGIWTGIMEIVGLALAIFGRIKAKAGIG